MSTAAPAQLQPLPPRQGQPPLTPDAPAPLDALRQEYGRMTFLKARAYAVRSLRGGRPPPQPGLAPRHALEACIRHCRDIFKRFLHLSASAMPPTTLLAKLLRKERIAFGERAGQQVRRIGAGFGHEGEVPSLTGTRCASVHGFSLHANTQVPTHRRDQLERLLRYTARGAVSLERLAQDANGDLVYTFTHPWSDGTTGIRLSPVELLEKLAALVPLPRVHLVRYGGCLAPHSHLRGAIIPDAMPTGRGGTGGQDSVASLELDFLPFVNLYLHFFTCSFEHRASKVSGTDHRRSGHVTWPSRYAVSGRQRYVGPGHDAAL